MEQLEDAAWRALKAERNTAVVAGPGAGKTEFLAQRAVFLLETARCPDPARILAISFKKDAAATLAARVALRCPSEPTRRFVSMTFDAFAKGMVDRFGSAIPESWRPTRPYHVVIATHADVNGFIREAAEQAPRREWRDEIAGIGADQFEARCLGCSSLPLGEAEPSNGIEWAVERWWRASLDAPGGSRLTFVMINRLADLLLRANPQIRKALRLTYRFVFLDEFQDVTYAQYGLLSTAFGGSEAVLTAVGDDKQRIMLWAGARPDAFKRFQEDFRADGIPLLCNYRSSPDLVRIQHVVALALEPDAAEVVARAERRIDGDLAQIWQFSNEVREANAIAAWIAQDQACNGLSPRDYGLLVRQRADKMEPALQHAFAANGLQLRNESRAVGRTSLQDLLAEDLTRMAVAVLRLAAERQAPGAWETASEAAMLLRAAAPDDEASCRRAERGLDEFVSALRRRLASVPPSPDAAGGIMDAVVQFLDPAALARAIPQYGQGEALAIAIEALRVHFSESADGAADWVSVLNRCEGLNQVPLLTIHKSKGLEYHTVLFLGLDDDQWWSYSPTNPEGLATFFVALSRAKQRVFFTYCAGRGARRKVDALYELLRQAGVPEVAG
ncbi:UvrD-helicase domain-containing protein [Azospirillum halopraeferens]|uniref:UvrD-helicase domain-containing protein n=1 Tax=Azospirillum halopraeferens TaxID=34010 RepID=UPI001B3BF7CE|nr:ATP-dependent helicase [Azospirillum halopraeferens]